MSTVAVVTNDYNTSGHLIPNKLKGQKSKEQGSDRTRKAAYTCRYASGH